MAKIQYEKVLPSFAYNPYIHNFMIRLVYIVFCENQHFFVIF